MKERTALCQCVASPRVHLTMTVPCVPLPYVALSVCTTPVLLIPASPVKSASLTEKSQRATSAQKILAAPSDATMRAPVCLISWPKQLVVSVFHHLTQEQTASEP